MAIWDPKSGMTYEQYLQVDSFFKDATGQIQKTGSTLESKISDQTLQLVANNEQLNQEFQHGFNSINGTLEWGFDHVRNALGNIENSIDAFHSDFNYGIGLLINQMQVQNQLFGKLISILDSIHKKIDEPTLTQAREHFNIGIDRMRKGLLDKALEAFKQAEAKNDTDCFTQLYLGKLYLYGCDDDDNVVNLDYAKMHLLQAARYAKAEIAANASFTKLAAEALLHAAIAVYAKLGDQEIATDEMKTSELLYESIKITEESKKLDNTAIECNYHLSKCYALLDRQDDSIAKLREAIIADRGYAVKVDLDGAFNPIRQRVTLLLSDLWKQKHDECKVLLNKITKCIDTLAQLDINNSFQFREKYQELDGAFERANKYWKYQTYYGFLDSISILENLVDKYKSLEDDLTADIKSKIETILHTSIHRISYLPACPENLKSEIEQLAKEIDALISEFSRGFALTAVELIKHMSQAQDFEQRSEEIEDQAIRLHNKMNVRELKYECISQLHNERKKNYLILGFIPGCIAGANLSRISEDFPYVIWILGCIAGILGGYLYSRMKYHKELNRIDSIPLELEEERDNQTRLITKNHLEKTKELQILWIILAFFAIVAAERAFKKNVDVELPCNKDKQWVEQGYYA